MTRHLIQEAVVYETYAEHEREQMQDLINERINDGWTVSHLCSVGDCGCTVVFNRYIEKAVPEPAVETVETGANFMGWPILLGKPADAEEKVVQYRVDRFKEWLERVVKNERSWMYSPEITA